MCGDLLSAVGESLTQVDKQRSVDLLQQQLVTLRTNLKAAKMGEVTNNQSPQDRQHRNHVSAAVANSSCLCTTVAGPQPIHDVLELLRSMTQWLLCVKVSRTGTTEQDDTIAFLLADRQLLAQELAGLQQWVRGSACPHAQ